MAKGKTGNIRFKKPIMMDLGDNPGQVGFADADQLYVWAQEELNWSESEIRKNIQLFLPIYDKQETLSRNLAEIAQSIINGDVSADSEVNKIKEYLASYRDHKSIHSRSQLGQLIASPGNAWMVSGALAAGLVYPLEDLFGQFWGQLGSQAINRFLLGYTLAQSTFPHLKDAGAADTRARLNRLLNTGQAEVKNWKAEHEKLLHEASEKLEKIQEDASEELKKTQEEVSSQAAAMEATKKQYEDFMKLRTPADYWKERAAKSSRLAKFGGLAFVAIAGLGLAGVYWGYPHLLSEFRSDDGSLGAGVIGLITVPAAIVLTALALVFRSVNSWLKDESAASERHTIIMTYIALAGDAERPIDERHRDRMLDHVLAPGLSAEHSASDQAGPMLGAFRAFEDTTRNDGE